jgi:short-subunit dehydrogenase
VTLVTGASGGIGRAIAVRMAGEGDRILVHGRDPDRTRAVASMAGGTALVADLSSPQDRRRLVEQAQVPFGRVDILVNNAGVGWSGPFTGMSDDDIRRLIEVDLLASIELTHALLPGMLERGSGAVCFVSSVAGRAGVAGEAVYSAAKAGLDIFAESLRLETAGTGVRVAVVVPGAVATGFFEARGRAYDRATPKPVPATAVADAVVRAIRGGRAETWVPSWLRIAPAVRAVAPGLYRHLSARFGEPVPNLVTGIGGDDGR